VVESVLPIDVPFVIILYLVIYFPFYFVKSVSVVHSLPISHTTHITIITVATMARLATPRFAFVVAAFAVLAIGIVAVAAQDAVTYNFDLTRPVQHFPHFWERCVGSGHALLVCGVPERDRTCYRADRCNTTMAGSSC
jgi:hypothetical protein